MNGSSLLEDSCDRNQEIILDQELCRCCHAKGKFKNLAESCSENGEEEIFADMLRYCFDIVILPLPGKLCAATYNICEVCIGLLRDANRFKKTVVSSEAKFKAFTTNDGIYKKLLNGNAISIKKEEEEPILVVKVEKLSDEISANHSGLAVHEDNTGDDFESPYDWDFGDAENKKETKKDKVIKSEKCENKKKDTKPRQKRDKSKKTKKASTKICIKKEDFSVDGTNFICEICNKIFTTLGNLKNHVKHVHYKISRTFKCRVCNKIFNKLTELRKHKFDEHNIDEMVSCNACQRTFASHVQLKRHNKGFHMLGKQLKCNVCDYKTFNTTTLYKHKFKHKTSKDFKCEFCGKTFLRSTTKNLHERIHTGDKRQVCTVCGQAFVQKASLNYHMTKHHPDINF